MRLWLRALPQLRASVEEIAAQYRALKERYLPSALEPISKTPTLLESNMVLCAAEVEKAQATSCDRSLFGGGCSPAHR